MSRRAAFAGDPVVATPVRCATMTRTMRPPTTVASPARRLAAAFDALRSVRGAIAVGAWLLAACAAPPGEAPTPPAAAGTAAITYFVTADPQINIPRWGTAGTEQTIDEINPFAQPPPPPPMTSTPHPRAPGSSET